MALNRGKYLTQAPSPSNIRVNVPQFSAFDTAINVASEIGQNNERKNLIDYERTLDVEKNKQADIKTKNDLLVKEEQSLQKQINQTHENSFTKTIIELEDKVFDLELKYPTNPAQIDLELMGWYEGLFKSENVDWLKDKQRFYKFQQKFKSLYNGAFKTANSNYIKKSENNTWEGINLLSERIEKRTFTNINRIQDWDDLASFTVSHMEDFTLLNDRLGNYVNSFSEHSDKTEADVVGIKESFIFNRDKHFISHILTNLVMEDVSPQSIELAHMLKNAWIQNKLPKKSEDPEMDLLFQNLGFQRKDIEDVFQIMSDNTDGYALNVEKTEKIIDHIDTEIQKKQDELKELYLSANEDKLSNYIEGEAQWNKAVLTIGFSALSHSNLEEIFVMKDPNSLTGNLIPDNKKISLFKDKQSVNTQLSEIVNFSIRGTEVEGVRQPAKVKDILEQIDAIPEEKWKLLNINKSDGLDIIKNAIVDRAFGGEGWNALTMFNNILDEGNFVLDQRANNGINMMRELNYIPEEMIKVMQDATLLNLKNESDINLIATLAYVKNKVFGKKGNRAFDTISPNFNEVINEVYNFVNGGDLVAGANHFKMMLNPSDNIKKGQYEALQKFKTTWKDENGFNITQLNDMTTANGIKQAAENEDWLSREAWTGSISNIWHWQSDPDSEDFLMGGMYTEYLDGTPNIAQSFAHLMQNENTFSGIANVTWALTGALTLGFAPWQGSNYHQNLKIKKPVQNFINEYVDNHVLDFIKMENPTDEHIKQAYDGAYKKAVQAVANRGLQLDNLIYDAENPNSVMLVEYGEALTSKILNGAMNDVEIKENAIAFMYHNTNKFGKTQDLLAEGFFGQGTQAKDLTVEQMEDYKSDFMSMAKGNQIRLQEVPDTSDTENPKYYIQVDIDGDGLFSTYTQNGQPVEWSPNDQFTSHNTTYSQDGLARGWAESLIKGETNLGGFNLENIAKGVGIDINNMTPKEENVLAGMLEGHIKAYTWKHNTLEGIGKFRKGEINTLSEYQTSIVKSFKGWHKTKQLTNRINFNDDQEQTIYNIKKSNNPNLVDLPNTDATKETVKKITEVAEGAFDNTYDDMVLPPAYEFVITDIIETLSNIDMSEGGNMVMNDNTTWKKIVGKDTQFYKFLGEGNYLKAKEELQRAQSYFSGEQQQRFNQLMKIWGVAYNSVQYGG